MVSMMNIARQHRKGIATAVIVAGLAMGMAGCENYSHPSALRLSSEQAISAGAAVSNNVLALEGRIIDVQPSEVSYCGLFEGGQGSRYTSNHEFIYVAIEDLQGKIHTMVYPSSKAFLERDASVAYKVISGGSIDARTFIHNYVDPNYFTDDNIRIEAEGIIQGITYK